MTRKLVGAQSHYYICSFSKALELYPTTMQRLIHVVSTPSIEGSKCTGYPESQQGQENYSYMQIDYI